jgi:hypothetical protein
MPGKPTPSKPILLLIIWPKGSELALIPTWPAQSFPCNAENIQEKLSCTEGISLTRMVNWQNFQRRLFRDSLEVRREKLSQSKWIHLCQTPQNSLKPRGFKEVILHRATGHSVTSDRRQTHFLDKAFYLSKDKPFCWLQTYLFRSPCSQSYFPLDSLFNWSLLPFTYSVFYFIKMFPVLNLNNKYFWFSCQLSVPFSSICHWPKDPAGLLLLEGTNSLLEPTD